LPVDYLLAGMGGGKLVARLSLLSKGNTVTLQTRIKVDHLDLGKMLRKLEIAEALEGLLDADASLKGQGGPWRQLWQEGKLDNPA
jgi:uncharacterized protein involved in outer membrane biogenesis